MLGSNSAMSSPRPRLIFAYADSARAARCVRTLRRNGWEVHMTASGAEALRLAQEWSPVAVVVDKELADGADWLTDLRLHQERAGGRLIVGNSAEESEIRQDEGAALADRLLQHRWAYA